MKVFAVYCGCRFEGGDVDRIYSKEEDAVKYAHLLFLKEDEQSKKIHDEDPERWAWQEDKEIPTISSVVKRWYNLVDEIVVREYPLS